MWQVISRGYALEPQCSHSSVVGKPNSPISKCLSNNSRTVRWSFSSIDWQTKWLTTRHNAKTKKFCIRKEKLVRWRSWRHLSDFPIFVRFSYDKFVNKTQIRLELKKTRENISLSWYILYYMPSSEFWSRRMCTEMRRTFSSYFSDRLLDFRFYPLANSELEHFLNALVMQCIL